MGYLNFDLKSSLKVMTIFYLILLILISILLIISYTSESFKIYRSLGLAISIVVLFCIQEIITIPIDEHNGGLKIGKTTIFVSIIYGATFLSIFYSYLISKKIEEGDIEKIEKLNLFNMACMYFIGIIQIYKYKKAFLTEELEQNNQPLTEELEQETFL